MNLMNNGHCLHASPIHAKPLMAILVAILLSGCFHIAVAVRDIQDTFSEASKREQALREEGEASRVDPFTYTAELGKARRDYAVVVNTVDGYSKSEIDQFRRDRLWGNMLTLKALSQWRLERFDDAIETRNEFFELPVNERFPRDMALMTALAGLIASEQAYLEWRKSFPESCDDGCKRNEKATRFETIKALVSGSGGAFALIGRAREIVPEDHPVQYHILHSQLIAYANLQRSTPVAVVVSEDPVLRQLRCDAHFAYRDLKKFLKDAKIDENEIRSVTDRIKRISAVPENQPAGC